jgi:hypothetical protein
MVEQVVVYLFIVYQNVLCEFRGVVVEKVTECFDDLGNSGSKVGVMFWQLLREGDERIKCPCLWLPEWKVGETASGSV